LREYTNPKEDEGRFKGWSSRAADADMTAHVVALSKSTPERDVFHKMYRHVYQKRQGVAGTGRKRKEIVEELINPNYAVDQWGLQGFSAVVQI